MAEPREGDVALERIVALEVALERASKRAGDSRARDRRSRQQRDNWIQSWNRLEAAITHHRNAKLRGVDASDEVDEALWAARDRVLSAAHSKDLDPLGAIGNEPERNSEPEKLRAGPGSQQGLGDLCPTCGTPVRVVGGDEGTSHYEPVDGR
jgi:hypothetical protein